MTVLTWNVQHASPDRSVRQAAWLAATDADVLILTEVSGSHDVLAAALHDHGFATLTPAPEPAHQGDYRVMLACRGLRLLTTTDLPRPSHQPHRWALAAVHPGDPDNARDPDGADALLVAGLYVPSRGPQERRNVDKRAFQQSVTDWLPALTATAGRRSLVVAGDLNVVEPGHIPHHRVFGAWEYDFYRSFAATGLVDAYRAAHPDGTDHSWIGRRSGAGYRFDHLFVNGCHPGGPPACHYDHRPRLTGLSDHSALIARLRTAVPTAY